MHFPTTTLALTLTLLTSLATASPALSPRQGGFFTSVGNKYSGPGCTSQSLIYADPIFGSGNFCQPLDRSGTGAPIVSYLTTQTTADCKVVIYTTTDCSGTAFQAPIGGCVTANAAFKSVFVTCPSLA